jgi:hypothetical protein
MILLIMLVNSHLHVVNLTKKFDIIIYYQQDHCYIYIILVMVCVTPRDQICFCIRDNVQCHKHVLKQEEKSMTQVIDPTKSNKFILF